MLWKSNEPAQNRVGREDFRWVDKVRCNTWGGKVGCNSAAKKHLSARPCPRSSAYLFLNNFVISEENFSAKEVLVVTWDQGK